MPSHYLNQCSNIVNLTPRNKLQWNFNRNSYIFIQENAFENVCKMVAISSQPQCVNDLNEIWHKKVFTNVANISQLDFFYFYFFYCYEKIMLIDNKDNNCTTNLNKYKKFCSIPMDLHKTGISSASALEILKCCTKSSIFNQHTEEKQPHISWLMTSSCSCWLLWEPGPRLNIKTVLSTYGDFHVKDKTAVRTSYL